MSEGNDVEFDFELRRYLLQRNAIVISREFLHDLTKFENLAAARSDRDALAAEVKSLRAMRDRAVAIARSGSSEAARATAAAILSAVTE